VMRILARVRERVPDITLTVICTMDRHADGYGRSVMAAAKSLGPWIQFRDNVSRDEMRGLMASYRYGIHGMREEHFGMAPAGLARGGTIVWVPRGGGQMEIVGNEPALMYDTDDDAVEKIAKTLTNPDAQRQLLEHLAAVTAPFSTTHFVRQVREIVDSFET